MVWVIGGLWLAAGVIFASAEKARKEDQQRGIRPAVEPSNTHREEAWGVC